MVGQRWGRLTVVALAGTNQRGKYKWLCRCDCSMAVVVEGTSLRRGVTTSCGCYALESLKARNYKHGHAQRGAVTRTYVTWKRIVGSCTNPNNTMWWLYGARGITVCDRWLVFENFLVDMGERPEDMTCDRIDGTRGYEPGNCRWATTLEQRHNQQRWIEYHLGNKTEPNGDEISCPISL